MSYILHNNLFTYNVTEHYSNGFDVCNNSSEGSHSQTKTPE